MAEENSDEFGFFNLNLRMFCSVPFEQILYMKQEQTLELKCSPKCIVPVIRNLEALLTFLQPLGREQGVRMLQEIHKDFPNNLNTIANLITVYKDLERESDVKKMQEKLDVQKCDNSEKGRYEKAKVFLEKGYVLLMDMHTETRESPETKIEQAISEMEIRKKGGLSGKSRLKENAANTVLLYLRKAQKAMSTIPEQCSEETKAELENSVIYLEKGITVLENISDTDCLSEVPLWKHHLAKAYNRIGNTKRTIMKISEKKQNLNAAVTTFVYCIEHIKADNNENKIYLARSYAYLGHLLETKKDIIAGKQEKAEKEKELSSVAHIWQQPMQAFDSAKKLAPNDRVMLNRYGLTLMQRQSTADNPERAEKKDNLQKALEVLDQSLESEPEYNWFGFSLRMQARVRLYKHQCKVFDDKKGKHPDVNVLKKALEDGKECLKLKTTLEDLMNVAEACYLLGINPKERRNLKNRVKDINQIYNALAYLHRAREHHQCFQHSRLYALHGKCLFDSGNKEQGIEKMKIALTTEPDKVRDPNTFAELINFLLHYYQGRKDDIFPRDKHASLRDMWCILLISRQKYGNRIRYPLIGAVNKYPHEFIDVLEYAIKHKRGKETKQLADQCIDILKRHNGPRVKTRASNVEQKIPDGFGVDDGSLPPEGKNEQSKFDEDYAQSKRFDFYVCHSEQDSDWVQAVLLPGLQLNWKGDTIFKGCFHNHPRNLDFETLKDNVRVFLFILTPSFMKNERCKDELSKLHKSSIDNPKHINPDCLIPVLMGNENTCTPFLLTDRGLVDFTNTYDWGKLHHVLAYQQQLQHPEADPDLDHSIAVQGEPKQAQVAVQGEPQQAELTTVTSSENGMSNENNGYIKNAEHVSKEVAENVLSTDDVVKAPDRVVHLGNGQLIS